jgi:hypothetical protein
VDLAGGYLLALFLTIAVETGIVWLLGFRTHWHMLAVAAINTLTHPVLNFSFLVLGFLGLEVSLGGIVLMEILVVVVEWRLLVYMFGAPGGRFLRVSLLMNAVSFLAGLLIFGLT